MQKGPVYPTDRLSVWQSGCLVLPQIPSFSRLLRNINRTRLRDKVIDHRPVAFSNVSSSFTGFPYAALLFFSPSSFLTVGVPKLTRFPSVSQRSPVAAQRCTANPLMYRGGWMYQLTMGPLFELTLFWEGVIWPPFFLSFVIT